jgi:hypothetical protein
MAGSEGQGKRFKPLKRHLPAMETSKAMCAVGAGLRGVKKTRISDVLTKTEEGIYGHSSNLKHQIVPLIRFAMAVDVSENYACGVNDGFENSLLASKLFYDEVDSKSLDYERGWHVGQAVAIVTEMVADQEVDG